MGSLDTPKETLNKSAAAEQQVFCSQPAVRKMGNIAQPLPAQAGLRMRHTPCGYNSIPSFSEPCLEAKSLAVSSCRFNQSFPNSKNVPETYCQGNPELLKMFKSKGFDCAIAKDIIADIPDLNRPILDWNGCSTTYLFEAEAYNNVEAVRFLLENGADPNLDIPDLVNDCPLHDLHFLWEEMQEEKQQRLEIVRLFFEFGADPDILYEDETLYDHVLWEVFNDSMTPHDWEYIKKFFIFLIAYGGGKEPSCYKCANLIEPIDRTHIYEYDFVLVRYENGCHLEGHVIAPDGKDIGTV